MLKTWLKRVLPDPLLLHLQAADHWWHGERELHLLGALCPRGRTAVDVGANIGTYAYFMRRHAADVIAYEPNPALAARLARLMPDVRVRHAAVSDTPGTLTLRVPVQGGRAQHELASVAQAFGAAEAVEEHRVPAVTLESENLTDVGFIKIDVEQHELAVLRGALGLLRRDRPNLMVEVSPLLYPEPLPRPFDFVLAEGYEGWFRFDGRYLPLAQLQPEVHAKRENWPHRFMANNLLLVPAERPRPAFLGA